MKPHGNKALFSNHYLDELLPKEEDFKVSISELKNVYEKIRGIWDKSRFEVINEDQLRKHFLDKVLEYLEWTVDVNAPIPVGEWSKRPDYALFLSNENLATAQKGKKDDYFKNVTCVGEAKRWGRPLDRKLKTEVDPFEVQNPSLQISRYLWLTDVKWGFLTDGKYWRLYERESSKRLDIFYEIDLEELIESGSLYDFRYFYLFFRKSAFPALVEKVHKGSIDYAEAVGKELKENIYHALKILAQGFLKTPGNNLTERHLQEIHDNALILLYRLLFIFYAEYRKLLPLSENKLYTESFSLAAFKKEIASRLDKRETIAVSTHGYWDKLKQLFEIVNLGNKELDVPPYNGGLFDPEKHNFLTEYRIGDLYVAEAVDLLSRSKDKAFIDYGSLEIRHLGSIYEGILEYKLKIAEQDLIPLKIKGKEVFVSLEEAEMQKKKINESEKVHVGEVYLVTDKGERKATGSYYTPDYIVKYIVENTLGPLVEDKKRILSDKINKLKNSIKSSRGTNRKLYEKELKKTEGSFINEILALRVLDPAMGSGHFLVEATDFLARELLKVLSGEPIKGYHEGMLAREPFEPYGLAEPEEDDIRWARREVIEKCIFGVDLNPMAVELAKLSLWLYTVAKNRPLNFLDHHLRCGNSLISARIEDLAGLPELKKKKTKEGIPQQLGLFESIFKEKVNLLLGDFAQIEELPSDTVGQIRKKEKLYQDFRKIVSRFEDIADVWTSNYIGNKIDFRNYQSLQDKLRSNDEEWQKLCNETWFKKAKEISVKKKFFHWELEFPEVFFEGHQRKENPGFDAVVGNPPYVLEARDNADLFRELKKHPLLASYYEKNIDLFCFFVDIGLDLLKQNGGFSFVVPIYWIDRTGAQKMRVKMVTESKVGLIVNFNGFTVFRDAPGHHSSIFKLLKNPISPTHCGYLEINVDPSKKRDEQEQIVSSMLAVNDTIPVSYRISSGKLLISKKGLDLVSRIAKVDHFFIDKRTIIRGVDTSPSNYQGRGVFVLTDNEISLMRNKLTQSEMEFIKPFFSASQLDSYYAEIDNYQWLIYTDKKRRTLLETHTDSYSTLINHLDMFKDIITSDNKPYGLHRSKKESYFIHNNKIAFVRKTPYPRFVYVPFPFFCDESIYLILPQQSLYSQFYLLSILNSTVAHYWFSQHKTQGGQLQIDKEIIISFPIRRFPYITSKDVRKELFDEATNHCKRYLETGKSDTILHFIESRLMKEHKPNAELVKKHNADPLNKDWQILEGALCEQSDVVHDILEFLAEQMIEMNKEKQKEIKGFLGWLESQLKVQTDEEGNKGIEALTGKSLIKNYSGDYQKDNGHLSFEDFWKILKKNENRIGATLVSRELYESIKFEYAKSLSKLLPLKERLHKTDWLIDQIVYKLYDLTEDEIKIVEQSIKG